jgi:hypothetical protein
MNGGDEGYKSGRKPYRKYKRRLESIYSVMKNKIFQSAIFLLRN